MRSSMADRRSFTMMEVLVVVLVAGILVTVAWPAYVNFIESSKNKVCESNLKALGVALDIYVMENGAVPATISQIPYHTLERAYAQLISSPGGWQYRIARAVTDFAAGAHACAGEQAPRQEFLKEELAKNNLKLTTCPHRASAGVSYGLNQNLASMSRTAYQALAGTTAIIFDHDSATFDPANISPARRHKRLAVFYYMYSTRGVTKDKTLVTPALPTGHPLYYVAMETTH
jgi:prepilin-type N-terminal cleavage/methylation domain-containing protein